MNLIISNDTTRYIVTENAITSYLKELKREDLISQAEQLEDFMFTLDNLRFETRENIISKFLIPEPLPFEKESSTP